MCEVKEWVCYDSLRMSITLGIKAPDRDCPVNFGRLINCSLSGYVRSTIFKAISPGGWDPVEDGLCIPAIVHSTVFEYKNGALGLAKSPRTTPRTRHIAVKYHFSDKCC